MSAIAGFASAASTLPIRDAHQLREVASHSATESSRLHTPRLRREDLLVPRDSVAGAAVAGLPERDRREFAETFSRRLDEFLDDCHGECLLRRPQFAEIVARALLHFDGERYHMGDFVVMPNHVHLMVQFLGADGLKRQCRSWKKFSAREIHEKLGRHGHFWQDESYDRLVRDPEEFFHYREYIAIKPKKARLKSGEFWYYKSPKADQFAEQGPR